MKKILLPLAIGSLLFSSAAFAQSEPDNSPVSPLATASANVPEARFLSWFIPPTGSNGRHKSYSDQLSCIYTGKWENGKPCHS